MNETSSVGIGYYASVLLKRWKAILGVALIGLLAAIAVLVLVPRQWTASTVVNLNVIMAEPFNPARSASGLLDVSTEDQVASSYVVAARAEEALGTGTGVQTLRRNTSVDTGSDATTVTISYTADSPGAARAGADAMANAYLAYRQDQAEARKERILEQLQPRVNAIADALGGAEVLGSTSDDDGALILAQIASVEAQINELALIDTSGGSVLTPAAVNAVTQQPQRMAVLIAGVLAGLVLGVVLAFILNSLDRRVRGQHDVESAGAGPVLGLLTAWQATVPATGTDLGTFRAVRERLLAAELPLTVLTVIDDSHADVPSDVAANLAAVMAQDGFDVELILMGAPADYFESVKRGLDLIPDEAAADGQVFRSSRIEGLNVFRPLGQTKNHGADEYVTEAVRRRPVGQAAESVTILALPPHAEEASRLAAGRLSGGAVIVAETTRTRTRELQSSANQMNEAGAVLYGAVLVNRGRKLAGAVDTAENGRDSQQPSQSISGGAGQ
ncbi:Wzz/FepE/Etk N-terminal domain-containing protein [Arthrobacter sp. H14]|uniref:Wzz/FepE/Etk N-terminal domain-containing protein n=1 Tax=Arthrobacter sp. H14 TaxID=1312959 RepID=UPI000562855E|nr:Wzz/FepE/Etk N-terminal domain-containing protein [Arthrobacter sp. H14]